MRVDAAGRSLDAVNHATTPFTGATKGDHPLLQTATSNNNLVQVDDPRVTNGHRCSLDPGPALPAGRTHEAAMDAEPWTCQEMRREGRLEAAPDPETPEVSDQRNDLWFELDKTTAAGSGVGIARGDRQGVRGPGQPAGTAARARRS